jgi:hypothetical protein
MGGPLLGSLGADSVPITIASVLNDLFFSRRFSKKLDVGCGDMPNLWPYWRHSIVEEEYKARFSLHVRWAVYSLRCCTIEGYRDGFSDGSRPMQNSYVK